MSGSAGARGYLYQAIASILEASCNDEWEGIVLEEQSSDEKIDISLYKERRIIKCIQVKSSKNQFIKSDAVKWMNELINDDMGEQHIELYLIGQCNKQIVSLKNDLNQYNLNPSKENIEKIKSNGIKNFEGKKLSISNMPYDEIILCKILRDSLFRYLSYNCKYEKILSYKQLELLSNAIVGNKMFDSIHEGFLVTRKDFNERLENWIDSLESNYTPQRQSIQILSLGEKRNVDLFLSLKDKFNKKVIKEQFNWYEDIYIYLKNLLNENLIRGEYYKIYLDCHLSISFAVGRIIKKIRGINIFPVQNTTYCGEELWEYKKNKAVNNQWDSSYEVLNRNAIDCALVLNVSRMITEDVKTYIKESNLPVKRMINCQLKVNGGTDFSIEDGNCAILLASKIKEIVKERSFEEKKGVLHIFVAAPGSFMYLLGQNSIGFGHIILYEYDLEIHNTGSYSKSIEFLPYED